MALKSAVLLLINNSVHYEMSAYNSFAHVLQLEAVLETNSFLTISNNFSIYIWQEFSVPVPTFNPTTDKMFWLPVACLNSSICGFGRFITADLFTKLGYLPGC